MKKIVGALAVLSLGFGLSACGSDSSSDTEAPATEATATEAAATEAMASEAAATEAMASEAAATEAMASEAPVTEAAAGATEAAAAATGGTQYVLNEWTLEGAATLPAGQVELTALNNGKFAHEFLVIKDTTYEDAPKDDLGSVLVDKLPAGSVLGEVEKIEPGATGTLSVDLAPGKYLFVCNITFGPNSHAGKGQRINVTVA